MENKIVFCLSGFLGVQNDWNILPFPHCSIDPQILKGKSLIEVGEVICSMAKQSSGEKILIGYSLGGRLALHALCSEPTLFSKAIIISAHTGLTDDHEKKIRRESDALWAKRFQIEPWEKVIEDWNAQSVFRGHTLQRSADDYDRELLSWQLTEWSLSQQEDLLPQLPKIKTEVLWITGEQDKKFSSIGAKAVYQLRKGTLWSCPDSGHRVPWENPLLFTKKAQIFIEKTLG